MSLNQAITSAKARSPPPPSRFKALKNRDSQTSRADSLPVAPSAVATDWVAKLLGPRFREVYRGFLRAMAQGEEHFRDRRP